MYDLIVIGAGPGGYEAAAYAGQLGGKVALIEKGSLGGTCLHVGCIPTKALLKSAAVFAQCRNAAAYGVQITGATFDLPAVMARKDRVVGTLVKGVEGLLKRSGVETIHGHARLTGRGAVAVDDGQILETRNILIATGSRPAVPPIPGLDSPAVLDSTGVLALTAPPSSLLVIGGGYIGLEFAAFFSAIGTPVTVLEMLPDVAGGLDREIARRLASSLRKAGVVIQTSCRVTSIDGDSVTYQDAAGAEVRTHAGAILNATGRVPVFDGLGLAEAGVDFDRRGIRTSDEGKTSVPGIWACGDVTGRRLLAHAATREGLVAVNNMFGKRDRMRYEAVPSVIYTHPEVASIGFTEEELLARGVDYKKAVVPMALAGRFLIENEGGSGVVKVLAGARYGEILGVHAIGDPASEFIVLAAALIEFEICAADAAETVFPHPTVSEALKAALTQLAQ